MNSSELISDLQRRRVPQGAYSIGSDQNEAYCLIGGDGEWHVAAAYQQLLHAGD